jgi:hypothetical protein
MATVWTFGDSLTERYNPIFEWSKDYIDWKGYVPKVYGNFVSEMLNYDLQNLGKAGCDNYTIFESFYKAYPNIKDGDIIIIGWTSVGRFRLANKLNKWTTLHPKFNNYLLNFDCISENTIDEIFVNRDNPKYIDEVNDWINFINLISVNKKIIHWSTIKGVGELNTHHFFEMERIYTETKGIITDAHFSENGQRQLADKILNALMTGNTGVKTNKLI